MNNDSVPGGDMSKDFKVKGITILGLVKLVKKKASSEEMASVIDNLDPADREVLQDRILVSSWYPYRVFNNLLESIDKVLGNGDGKLAYEIGRMSAERDLTTVYRSILSFLSTGFVTKKAFAAWKNYYSSGELELIQDARDEQDRGRRVMKVRMKEFRTLSTFHCMNIVGWCEKFVELLGVSDVSVEETSCIHKGGDHCEFLLSWKEKD
ncbi:MAG: hypothetical protein GXP49_04540 [Deltaproteobacteria bacterium]|nr:hypothetical protein [Deltaproteobacteria bacterium]